MSVLPSLSVLMSNYNHARFLPQSLGAIVEQSYQPDEFIIIDDASTDNSVEIIEAFVHKHSFIRFIRNEHNMGGIYNVNRLVELSSSEYIYAGAAADDRILPGFFEKSMHLLSQYPGAGLCCSDPASFVERKGPVYDNRLYWSDKPCYFPLEDLSEIIQGGYIAGHTSIVKRSALLDAGSYIDDLKWHCDWFASLVIAFRSGICYIPEPLATIWSSPTTYSGSGRQDWSEQSKVLNHLLHLLKLPEYRDVLPYFIRGSVMSHFGDEIVRVVMENPEHWDMETMMLIQNPLWQWNLRLNQQQQERAKKSQQTNFEKIARTMYERGNKAVEDGRLDEALSIFMEMVNKFPGFVDGYVALSKVATEQKNFEIARGAILGAIKINPNKPELQNRLGMIHFQSGDHLAAGKVFEKALALNPSNIDAYINLAVVAQSRGLNEKSIGYFEEGLKRVPNDVNSLVEYGEVAHKFNATGVARSAFQKALLLDPLCDEALKAKEKLAQIASNRQNQCTCSEELLPMQQDILFQQLKHSAMFTICDIYALCLKAFTGKSTFKTAIIGYDNSILNNTEMFFDCGINVDAYFEGIPGDIYHPSLPLEEIIGKSFDLILFGSGKSEEDEHLLSTLVQLGEQNGRIETPIFGLSRIHSTSIAALGSLQEFPTCLNFRKLAMITLGVSLSAGAGCIIECGTFLGGTTLYIASLLREYQQDNRHLYAIDTFEGMPAPVAQDGKTIYQAGLFTETTFEKVNTMIHRHKVADRMTLLKGLVQDCLPDIWRNEDQVSFALVDTDQYAGTKSSLLEIVPHLACNGIIVVDDYCLEGVQKAISEVMTQYPTLRGVLITYNFYILYKETDFRFLSIWKS